MRALPASLSLVLVLLTSSAAAADPITVYGSWAAWQAATVGPLATTTFETDNQGHPFPMTGGFAHLAGCCPSFGNVMFFEGPPAGDINIADTATAPGYGAWHTGNVLSAFGGDTLTISGFTPAFALAFDWQLWGAGPLSILLSTGDSITPTVTPFAPTFFGIVSTVPITSVAIAHHGTVLNIDNFTTAQPTPEPATVMLLALGLAGSMARRLRHSRDQAADGRASRSRYNDGVGA